jgi:hypothetical protein
MYFARVGGRVLLQRLQLRLEHTFLQLMEGAQAAVEGRFEEVLRLLQVEGHLVKTPVGGM